MKHIIKDSEPQQLLNWKAKDKMYQRNRPRYSRITGDVRIVLATSLRIEQGNICCYCEQSINAIDSHTEHILPQTRYQQFSCDYDNMICSCQRDIIKGDPEHCVMGKDDWYDVALFISPLDPTCEDKFSYTFDGQILPTDVTDQAAVATIERCKLDIPKLKALREGVLDTFTDDSLSDAELTQYVQSYLIEKDANNGYYNPFFTTIRILFGHLVNSN